MAFCKRCQKRYDRRSKYGRYCDACKIKHNPGFKLCKNCGHRLVKNDEGRMVHGSCNSFPIHGNYCHNPNCKCTNPELSDKYKKKTKGGIDDTMSMR